MQPRKAPIRLHPQHLRLPPEATEKLEALPSRTRTDLTQITALARAELRRFRQLTR